MTYFLYDVQEYSPAGKDNRYEKKWKVGGTRHPSKVCGSNLREDEDLIIFEYVIIIIIIT